MGETDFSTRSYRMEQKIAVDAQGGKFMIKESLQSNRCHLPDPYTTPRGERELSLCTVDR